jgi:hypothetical protein
MLNENIHGSPLYQLQETYEHKAINPHPGILVVICGHHAKKLEQALNLFEQNKPEGVDYHVAIVCNGTEKVDEKYFPEHTIGDVIYRENTGWDIAMFAEAVLKYKFKYYWFMNDDIAVIKNGNWLKEFNKKIKMPAACVVGVQAGSPYNYRTSYFGVNRLYFLSWYVTVNYGVLKKKKITKLRHANIQKKRGKVEGYMLAKAFEHWNLNFTHVCGLKPRWLRDFSHLIDDNARCSRGRAFLQNPREVIDPSIGPRKGLLGFGEYLIEDLWSGDNVLTIEHIIEHAKWMEGRIKRGFRVI